MSTNDNYLDNCPEYEDGQHCPCYYAGYECCECGAIEVNPIVPEIEGD